ncbi:MAG: hypothetical protein KatS3mg117_3420 [Geminicoccaceae bacterium]|nr:MAG: hypothetical protein KatS3mg117_3420 [Geminicoccaceae bacterium]
MFIATVGRGPATERARAPTTPRTARAWVDPGSSSSAVETPPTPGPPSGGPIAPLAGLDALLVLQRVEEPSERTRRAVRRGEHLLAGLDALQRGLLDGVVSEARLRELRRGLADLEAMPDQPRLQAVLREIATRVEVELAKLEVAVEREAAGAGETDARRLALSDR